MANNTPARIFLDGVEQHHCRDWRTGPDGMIIKRKQTPDGSMVIDPVTRTWVYEHLTGLVVAIGDDSYVGGTVQPPSQGSSAQPSAPRIESMVVRFDEAGTPVIETFTKK